MQQHRDDGSIDAGTNPAIHPERNRGPAGDSGGTPPDPAGDRGPRPGHDRARERTVIEDEDAAAGGVADRGGGA